MSSPPPLICGAYYHLFNRGTNRENIFIEEKNYPYFLRLYAEHIESVAETFAFCLLKNHFHLLVRIKSEAEIEASLPISKHPIWALPSKKFSELFIAYAKSTETPICG